MDFFAIQVILFVSAIVCAMLALISSVMLVWLDKEFFGKSAITLFITALVLCLIGFAHCVLG